MLLESTNTLLSGHTCALSTNDLQNHIQSHIHSNTVTASTTAELHLITDYDKYKHTLKVINNAHIHADNLLKATMQQMWTTSTAINNSLMKHIHKAVTTSSSTTLSAAVTGGTTSHSADCCPPLTTVKRALLMEHSGCFHCCHFYAGHIAPACMNGFPEKATYRPLTEADTLAVKRHNNKMRNQRQLLLSSLLPP
jgi:hypothetical protein